MRFSAMRDRRLVPYRLGLKMPARRLRRDATPTENQLWYQFLRTLPQKFTRQKPLGSYVADFYCSEHRLVIEIDGDTHFTDVAERRDASRTQALERLGLTVLRFTNIEVRESFEGVCARILDALKT
jgi:very-short-patch-repair endonuclease